MKINKCDFSNVIFWYRDTEIFLKNQNEEFDFKFKFTFNFHKLDTRHFVTNGCEIYHFHFRNDINIKNYLIDIFNKLNDYKLEVVWWGINKEMGVAVLGIDLRVYIRELKIKEILT